MKTQSSAKKSKSTKTGAKSSAKTEKVEKTVAADVPVQEDVKASKAVAKKPADKFRKFFLWNVWLAVIYGAQGIALLLLSVTKKVPVTTEFLSQDKLASALSDKTVLATATERLFDVNLAQLLAVLLFVAAIAHLLMATVYRSRYEAGLTRRANKFRWVEYGLTSGLFMVIFGLLVGIANIGTLLMLFTLTMVAFVSGLVMELYRPLDRRPSRFLCTAGFIAGLMPWVVVSLVLFGANIWGEGSVPAYLYWFFGSALAFSVAFGTVVYLQYKNKGKWADYLYSERVLLPLSLVANTALVWQLFAGALRP